MDINKHTQQPNSRTRDRYRDREEEERASSPSSKQSQPPPPPPSSPPPSSSSSPNHEFSFTISLHSVPDKNRASSSPSRPSSSSSIAVDLSPADDIFFHGHLLPLHFLSHLPSPSPRASTNSIETLSAAEQSTETEHPKTEQPETEPTKPAKPFSLFGLNKWRKGSDPKLRQKGFDGGNDFPAKPKTKPRFELSHAIKRYVRMVRPFLLLIRRRRRRRSEFRRHPPYSFSGNLADLRNSDVEKQDAVMRRGRRGGFFSSAPASMRTSPTNSGLLLATAEAPRGNSDSTMEELQAAIQAAIAHCKNSIAVEEKLKCQ